VNDVTDAVQGLSQAAGPKVYHEVTPQLVTASEASLEGDLYRLLRARNIAGAGGGTAYPQLSPETIVAANPDVIVIASGSGAATPEAVGARAGWGDIVAMQESRTFTIDGAIVSRRGPRIVDALEQLGESLYPDRFE
jgi:iron complex transport system substrate-binding protein